MMCRTCFLGLMLFCGYSAAEAAVREWTDKSGAFSLEAELVDFDSDQVVLKKPDGHLVAVPIADLSKADQEHLKSDEAQKMLDPSSDKSQTWTLQDGTKLAGRVVDYARKSFTIERRRGKVYVDERLLSNLPQMYRHMVPKIVAHYEKTPIENDREFQAWVLQQRGQPREFTTEGIMLETESGDEYAIPFFFFSEADQAVLKPGFDHWLAMHKDDARQDQLALHLESLAQTYQQDRKMNQQVAMMQLAFSAAQTGIADFWEVQLLPKRGATGSPMSVVVMARGSAQATTLALEKNPNYVAGIAKKLNRRGR